jgi:hypothetical protein
MRSAVKRDGDRVWIEGIRGYGPSEYADSVHGAQARILQSLGESLTYEDLLCYSAFAFRVSVHDDMCPSAGHPCCGYVCLENGQRAIPWNMRVFESFPWSEPLKDREAFEAEVNGAIRESIDAGVPVHYGSEEDGLIIGYGEGGMRWLCLHPYHRDRDPFWYDEALEAGACAFAGGRWPWAVVVWTEQKPQSERVSERELTAAALGQAVDMWRTGERHEEHYLCGRAAYGHWLDWLRGVEDGRSADPESGMQGNGWCFDVLAHSRRIAGPWLSAKAAEIGGDAGADLAEAADEYGQLAAACLEGLNSTWELALPPRESENWTGQMRRDQIRRLEVALERDGRAIAAIERALALGGSDWAA